MFARSPDAGGRAQARLGLLLAINGLNLVNGYVARDFMTAIEQRSMGRFLGMAALYVGVLAGYDRRVMNTRHHCCIRGS